jgi:hypothetical protein
MQPFMTVLDCADPSMMVDKRNETVTPLQALAMLNNPLALLAAERFAHRVAVDSQSFREQIRQAVRIGWAREPNRHELDVLAAYAERHGLANGCRVILNSNEFVFVD